MCMHDVRHRGSNGARTRTWKFTKNEEMKRNDEKRNFIDYMLVFGGTTHVWSHTCVIVCVCDVWI